MKKQIEFNGTKGNWEYQHRIVDDEGNYITQVYNNQTVICDLHWAGERIGNVTHSRRGDNAMLIAAAPDLLKALQDIIKHEITNNPFHSINSEEIVNNANKAIAKALGNESKH